MEGPQLAKVATQLWVVCPQIAKFATQLWEACPKIAKEVVVAKVATQLWVAKVAISKVAIWAVLLPWGEPCEVTLPLLAGALPAPSNS